MPWAVLLALLLFRGCGAPDEIPFPNHPPRQERENQHVASDAAVAVFLRGHASRPSIDCGIGRDPESDARVYDCGSRAIAARQSFFCQYVADRPASVAMGDIVTQLPAPFLTAGYLYDSASSSLWVASATTGQERVTKTLVSVGPEATPTQFLRGMHPPTLSRGVTGTSPSTEVSGVVIVECVIDTEGKVTRPRVVKPLPRGVDAAAVALLKDARFEPGRLFGLPLPVLWYVSVHAENGTLSVAPAH